MNRFSGLAPESSAVPWLTQSSRFFCLSALIVWQRILGASVQSRAWSLCIHSAARSIADPWIKHPVTHTEGKETRKSEQVS